MPFNNYILLVKLILRVPTIQNVKNNLRSTSVNNMSLLDPNYCFIQIIFNFPDHLPIYPSVNMPFNTNLLDTNYSRYKYVLLPNFLLLLPPAKQSLRGYTFFSVSMIPKFHQHLRLLPYNFNSFCPILFRFIPHLNHQTMHV